MMQQHLSSSAADTIRKREPTNKPLEFIGRRRAWARSVGTYTNGNLVGFGAKRPSRDSIG